jgi:Flp pilus assembly protein CpaB
MFDGLLAPVGSGAGFQAMIPAGMRAVTLDVSESSAVAGMLMPGSKVDVIGTLRKGDQTIAKAIVENVKVQYVQRAKSGYSSKGGAVENGPVKTVTLLVTPKQANAIELANAEGSKPRLVLRSTADTSSGNSEMSSNELRGIADEPEAVQAAATPPPADDTTFENVKPEAAPVNRRAAQIIRGSAESTIYFDENQNGKEEGKKEAGNGTTPTAEKKTPPAGDERRTDAGKSPESSSPRTEAR